MSLDGCAWVVIGHHQSTIDNNQECMRGKGLATSVHNRKNETERDGERETERESEREREREKAKE